MLLDNWLQLNVQTKPVEPLVEGGAQIQQVLNIECLTDFSDAPQLNIKFRWALPKTAKMLSHKFSYFVRISLITEFINKTKTSTNIWSTVCDAHILV